MWIIWTIAAVLALQLWGILALLPKISGFTWRIWFLMLKVKSKIRRLARQRGIKVRVFWFGAVRIHPRHMAIWIVTPSASERDDLYEDESFGTDCREILRICGYPSDAISGVGFAIESQQTVDREFGGNWYRATK